MVRSRTGAGGSMQPPVGQVCPVYAVRQFNTDKRLAFVRPVQPGCVDAQRDPAHENTSADLSVNRMRSRPYSIPGPGIPGKSPSSGMPSPAPSSYGKAVTVTSSSSLSSVKGAVQRKNKFSGSSSASGLHSHVHV